MHVYLTSPSGGLDTPDEITVTANLPQDLGPLDIETVPGGPNHVIGYDVNLPVAGLWTFDVTAPIRRIRPRGRRHRPDPRLRLTLQRPRLGPRCHVLSEPIPTRLRRKPKAARNSGLPFGTR